MPSIAVIFAVILTALCPINALKLNRVVSSAFAALSLTGAFHPHLALAAANVVSGSISLAEGASIPSGDKVALYLTIKQDPGVWKSAVRNIKDPPILTKRLAPVAASFPQDFSLSAEADSTPEGKALLKEWQSGRLPLLVSARLDQDGVAATRSPDDLVGQSSSSFKDGSWEKVQITLQGRGVAGKFITTGRK